MRSSCSCDYVGMAFGRVGTFSTRLVWDGKGITGALQARRYEELGVRVFIGMIEA